MTNDKSNKELDKSTLRIPTFNMILRKILVVNAYGEKAFAMKYSSKMNCSTTPSVS